MRIRTLKFYNSRKVKSVFTILTINKGTESLPLLFYSKLACQKDPISVCSSLTTFLVPSKRPHTFYMFEAFATSEDASPLTWVCGHNSKNKYCKDILRPENNCSLHRKALLPCKCEPLELYGCRVVKGDGWNEEEGRRVVKSFN